MLAATSPRKDLFLILSISLAGSLYGYNIGAMSGALLLIKAQMALSHIQASLFVAAFLWGIVLAMLVSGYFTETFGRKPIILFASVVALLASLITLSANDIEQLFIGRLLSGIAGGMLSLTVPVYLSETLPSSLRGRGTVAFQLFITFGILLATLISWHSVHANLWQLIFIFELIPVGIVLAISIMIPESPHWLVNKNKPEHALQILMATRSRNVAEQTLVDIIKNKKLHQNISHFRAFFQKHFFLPLLLAISLSALNQLTGINVFLQYDSTILFMSGFDQHNTALVGSVIITALNFFMTIFAICIADYFERKRLLQFGLVGIIICLCSISIAHHFIENLHTRAFLVTILLLGFIVFFAIGPGALVWTLMTEILPTKIRSIGASIALLIGTTMGAIFSTIFLPLQQIIGFSGIFLLCALTTSLYFFISRYIPKTNQYTLEEIETHITVKHSTKVNK